MGTYLRFELINKLIGHIEIYDFVFKHMLFGVNKTTTAEIFIINLIKAKLDGNGKLDVKLF